MTQQLKSDRMLDALERLEVIKDELKHDRADIGNHLHMTIETLKDALAQQLLTERRRTAHPKFDTTLAGEPVPPEFHPLTVKGYNDEPPERSTLGHTGHPPADRGGSEVGCYG